MPAAPRFFWAKISISFSGGYLPRPTSTNVPTVARTIPRRNRSARIVKIYASSEKLHDAWLTVQMFVLLSDPVRASDEKSCEPSKYCAACCIAWPSKGVDKNHDWSVVKGFLIRAMWY